MNSGRESILEKSPKVGAIFSTLAVEKISSGDFRKLLLLEGGPPTL